MDKDLTTFYKQIGQNIRERRKAKGMGQEVLAELTSLSRSSIANIELGNQFPSIHTIYDICIALHCELNDIFTTKDNYNTLLHKTNTDFQDIINKLSPTVSRENMERLLNILNS